MNRAVLQLAVVAVLAAACVTRPAPTPSGSVVAHPRVVAQLEAYGVTDPISREMQEVLAGIHCQRPPGTLDSAIEPQMLRALQAEGLAIDLPAIAAIETVLIIPAELCQPASGSIDAAEPLQRPAYWQQVVDELVAMRDALRAALASDLAAFSNITAEFDYATPGVMTMRYEIEPGATTEDYARRACITARIVVAMFTFNNVRPLYVALMFGDHDPQLDLTIQSGDTIYALESAPGRLSDAVARCIETQP